MSDTTTGGRIGPRPGLKGRRAWLIVLTGAVMLAFAANSFLARLAFRTTAIDAASYTTVRLVAGALTLALILRLQKAALSPPPSAWPSAVLLFIYAAAFSFAYRDIGTGAGALVLFASAQLVMISYGLHKGERTSLPGMLLACAGMLAFLAPSTSAPPALAAILMAIAGAAWGGFSLLGKAADSPMGMTTASFLWTVPLALALSLVQGSHRNLDWSGAQYAVVSGSITSALGYALWYWVRVRITAISAGAVQLCVPLLSAMLGWIFLGEKLAPERLVSGLAVLSGIAWVTVAARKAGPR
ncbi:DMT family transporter [Massilia terrae]|uniref:DMT family transporter n=1 Tax=Massilia terrae TaxID=1811224 RepID=A0ABT2CVA8_9BURK|nr:DMT family transporter [Massilia terrae]MCS0657917.1 DMT family transporter [Massilia terrae]